MKLLVDNQSTGLAAPFLALGYYCLHAIDVDLDESGDEEIWSWAHCEDAVVISKDEDFVFLANRPGDKRPMYLGPPGQLPERRDP